MLWPVIGSPPSILCSMRPALPCRDAHAPQASRALRVHWPPPPPLPPPRGRVYRSAALAAPLDSPSAGAWRWDPDREDAHELSRRAKTGSAAGKRAEKVPSLLLPSLLLQSERKEEGGGGAQERVGRRLPAASPFPPRLPCYPRLAPAFFRPHPHKPG